LNIERNGRILTSAINIYCPKQQTSAIAIKE